MERLKLSTIRADGGTQSRCELSSETVEEYAAAMTDGQEFPPVIVFYDGQEYWLADGFHRIEAANQSNFLEIEADVRQGTRRDAVLFSVGANASHGLRRTNADKRRAVMTLLEDDEWNRWSNREIARRCGVHNTFVDKVRKAPSADNRQMERKAERGGTIYTVDTANIGKRPTHQPVEVADSEPEDEPLFSEQDIESFYVPVMKPRPKPVMESADPLENLRLARVRLYTSTGSPDPSEKLEAIHQAIAAIDAVLSAQHVA